MARSRLRGAKGLLMLDAPGRVALAARSAGTLTSVVEESERAFVARRVDPATDGKDDRSCGRRKATAGGEDLQQHDPRRFDDRRFGGVRAREKLGSTSRSCSTSRRVIGLVLVDGQLLSVPGPVPTSPVEPRFQAGFTAAMMLKDMKLSQDGREATGANHRWVRSREALRPLTPRACGGIDFSGIINFVRGRSAPARCICRNPS